MGYRPEDLLGRTAFELVHPEDIASIQSLFEACMQTGEPARTALRVRNAGGRFLWLESSAQVLRDDGGRPCGLIISSRDITDRRRTEEALRENQEILDLFIEHAPAAIAMFDSDMRYLAVSRRWRLDYGLPEENLRGRSHYEVFPEITETWKAVHRRALDGEVVTADADSFTRADGAVQWLKWEVRPWRRPDNTIGGIIIFTEDISERRQAEAALRLSEERLRMATTGANLGTWHWNIRSGELVWSPRCLAMFGLPPDTTMSYEKFLTTLHPEDRAATDAAVQRALKERTDYDIEFRSLWPDGTLHWIASKGRAGYDGAGRPVRMEGVTLEITERKQAEAATDRLRRQNELLLNSAGEGIFGLDLDGGTTFINPAGVRMLGRDPQDIVGKQQHALSHHTRSDGSPYPREECPIYAAFKDGQVHHRDDEVFWRKDGSCFPVEYVSTPIREDGRPVGAVVVFRDISERKKIEDLIRKHALQQSLLSSLGQRALSGIALGELFDEAVTELARCLDVEYCKILEHLPGGDALLLLAGVGWKEGLVGLATVAADKGSQAGYTLLADGPVQVQDLAAETRFTAPSLLIDHGVVSGLSVIIRGPARPFGVLGVHSRQGREFSRDEVNFLTAVANVLANAIEAERAKTELERRIEERTLQLRLAQEEIEQFFAVSLDPMCILGFEGHFKRLNPAWETVLGWSTQELLSTPHMEFIHPEDREASKREFAKLAEGGVTVDFENRYRCKDGSFRWFLWSAVLLSDRPFVFAAARDVTEMKRVAQQLTAASDEAQRTALRLRAILDNAVDGIITIDESGVVESVNPAAERLFGYAGPEVVGQNVKMLMPAPYREQHDGYLAAYRQTGIRKIIGIGREVVGLRKDGSTFPMALSVSEAPVAEGRMFTGIVHDITDRKQVEAAVAERIKLAQLTATVGLALTRGASLQDVLQQCAQALVDHLGAAFARIWTLNEADDVLELQASAGMYTHRDGPHGRVPVGQFKIGLIAAERRPHLTNSVVGDSRVGDQDWARREGMVAFAGYPLLLSDRLIGVMAMFAREPLNDATLDALAANSNGIAVGIARHRAMDDLLQAKQEADRANRAKSEFLSRMSHELRTPLNGILGFGQRLLSSNLAARDQQRAEQVVKAGRHLLDLINEVLDLSRIEAGHTSISPEPISVANALGEALDLVRPLAQQRQIHLHQEPIPGDWHVLADNQRLKQVLLNLLSNAVKYNRERGSVTVSCKDHAPSRLLLSVTDSGAGIPADKLGQLFEPFNRLGAERTAVEGTGLGLAVTRRLVELMGGSVNAASELDKGTTFVVDLARAVAPKPGALVSDSAKASNPSAARRTLLYIEDNLANVSLLEDILIDRPAIRLLTAMQGGLGLDLARQHHPDLILLDVHLPDIMGDEVLRRLQADPKLQGIPVVVLSADATSRQIEVLRSLGARDYLTKPLDVARFLQVVDEALHAGN